MEQNNTFMLELSRCNNVVDGYVYYFGVYNLFI